MAKQDGTVAEDAAEASNGEVVKFLSRDDILGVNDVEHENVAVPEWGGVVRVKALMGIERDAFERTMFEQKGSHVEVNMRNLRARLVAMAVVDADGKPLFQRTDIEVLGQKSAKALDRVYDVAQTLAGLKKEDVDRLTGNSETTPDDSSTSF